jgi:hypothetical protein
MTIGTEVGTDRHGSGAGGTDRPGQSVPLQAARLAKLTGSGGIDLRAGGNVICWN